MLIFSGKIPVRVNPFFLVLMLLIGWLNASTVPEGLVWMGVVFISVLVHEFGHALTGLSFGQRAEIELHGLGGVTRRHGKPLKLWQEFLIVLNGPLAGLTLFVFAYQMRQMLEGQPTNLVIYALQITMYVNLFWTVVNLLPVYPLDGGQLMRIFLEGIFGFRGVKIAMFLSMILAAFLGLFFLKFGILLAAVLFFMFAFESYRYWQSAMSVTEKDQDIHLQNILKEAEDEMRRGNLSEAMHLLDKIREETNTGIIYMAASELSARILYEEGHYKEGYGLLNPLQKKLSGEGLVLLHQLAYKSGHWEDAIRLGNRAYQNIPNYETALINALCHSILGQAHPAIGWLQTATNQGLPNLSQVLKKREFDHIRHDPQFQNLLDQARHP